MSAAISTISSIGSITVNIKSTNPIQSSSEMAHNQEKEQQKKRKHKHDDYMVEANKKYKDQENNDPEVKALVVWNQIKEHLPEIYSPSEIRVPLKKEVQMQLYNEVYKLWLEEGNEDPHRSLRRYSENSSKAPRRLYKYIEDFFCKHLSKISKNGKGIHDNLELLKFYSKEYADFYSSSFSLDSICNYLNRNWIVRQQENGSNTYEVLELANSMWRNTLFGNLHEKVTQAMLAIIQSDRELGKKKEFSYVKELQDVIKSYIDVGKFDKNGAAIMNGVDNLRTYVDCFEQKFLDETERFYYSIIQQLHLEDPIKAILLCDEKIECEEQRVEQMFHPSTKEKVVNLCLNIFVVNRLDNFYEVFKYLLKENMTQELASFYALINRLSAQYVNGMAQKFEQLVLDIANEDLEKALKKEDNKRPIIFCGILIDFVKKYKVIVTNSFKDDRQLDGALQRALSAYLNNNEEKDGVAISIASEIPKYLALFADNILNSKSSFAIDKTKTEDDFKASLQDIIFLLAFIADNDIFKRLHKFKYAYRLIGKTSISHLEIFFLNELRNHCGADYFRTLNTMYNDVLSCSQGITTDYKSTIKENGCKKGVDFSVCILDSKAWSLPALPEIELPEELNDAKNKFALYYTTKNNKRKLLWSDFGTFGELVYRTERKQYTLIVSTFEMIVLLLFNEADEIKFEQIKQATKMEFGRIKAIVDNLETRKILKYIAPPNGEEEMATATAVINQKFYSKHAKITCNMGIKADKNSETKKQTDDIKQQRQFIIQAALVRSMKGTQTQNVKSLINDIIGECNKTNGFGAPTSEVKKAINKLIDGKFVAYKDPKTLVYVA